MDINYVCSLGTHCHSSQILKNNKLKKCSYPFDWIFSNCDNIIHCIEDDFKIFLDKSYYIKISFNKCGHSYYHKNMFNHHNLLDNINDYNYYVRCVDRFRKMIKTDERKLFIMSFLNKDIIDENIKNDIINFNDKFSKYTKNYTLLVIFHIKNKKHNYHMIEYTNNNIDFLELHTLSESDGVKFKNKYDNDYLNDIIMKMYTYNIFI